MTIRQSRIAVRGRVGARLAVIACLAAPMLGACSGGGDGEEAAPDGGHDSHRDPDAVADGTGGRGGSGGAHSTTGSGGAHSTSGSGGAHAGAGAGGADHDSGPDDPGAVLPFKCEVEPNQVIDKLDLLFAVDNSNSMREEQTGLSAQFAHMVDVLTSGDRDADGVADFPAVTDLHLGVVTSDMGLGGIADIPHCSALGQDGILQHVPAPTATDCQTDYPTFLSYAADTDDAAKAATDLGCIATVGTDGCGFEQQLEAPLKALWPSLDPMPKPDGSNRITFVGDGQGNGTLGHGDSENIGFLRNDPAEGLSLIAIIVVTDEEDCSSSSSQHFTPPWMLDPNDPLAAEPLDLRCYYNETNNGGDELFTLDRYVQGFKALRSGNEDLVVFGAIAGVPPDLVDRTQLDKVDFGDAAMRDAFYSAILADQRMQEVIDPESMTMPGSGHLLVSCNSETGKAYPPRRIVKVAQEFGENGMVQSICQKDLRPAIDAIVGVIAKRLRARCE